MEFETAIENLWRKGLKEIESLIRVPFPFTVRPTITEKCLLSGDRSDEIVMHATFAALE